MGAKFPSDLNLSDWWASDNSSWVFEPFTRVEVSLVTSNPHNNCGQGGWNLRQKVFAVCPAGWGCRFASDGAVDPKILISPNPTSDVLRFTNMDIRMYDFDVYISDIAGKVVKQIPHLNQEFINLSDLDDGMYVLKIYKDGQYESTYKVVIAK